MSKIKSSIPLLFGVLALASTSALGADGGGSTNGVFTNGPCMENFQVIGAIAVDNRLMPSVKALKGIEAKVSLKSLVSSLEITGTATTDANGLFRADISLLSLIGSECASARTDGMKLTISVRFDGPDFRIMSPGIHTFKDFIIYSDDLNLPPGTYTLYGNSGGYGAVAILPGDLPTFASPFVIAKPCSDSELADQTHSCYGNKYLTDTNPASYEDQDEAWNHASIWAVYRDIVDYFKGQSINDQSIANYLPGFAFTKKFGVLYPQDSPYVDDTVENSFASPVTQRIYLVKNSIRDISLNTILHELMHIWAYQHSSGELDLAREIIDDQNTHDFTDRQGVAFHEGLAEFASRSLSHLLYNDVFDYVNGISLSEENLQPLSRAGSAGMMTSNGQAVSSDALDNKDDLWMSTLFMLTLQSVQAYSFNVAGGHPEYGALKAFATCSPAPWSLGFEDVLRVFLSNSRLGRSQLETQDIELWDFLVRVNEVNPTKFDLSHANVAWWALNPNALDEPFDIMDCSYTRSTRL